MASLDSFCRQVAGASYRYVWSFLWLVARFLPDPERRFEHQGLGNMAALVSKILERIVAAGKLYERDELGSRESLIDLARDLVAALELPSEFLQRSFWAEVREQHAII